MKTPTETFVEKMGKFNEKFIEHKGIYSLPYINNHGILNPNRIESDIRATVIAVLKSELARVGEDEEFEGMSLDQIEKRNQIFGRNEMRQRIRNNLQETISNLEKLQ